MLFVVCCFGVPCSLFVFVVCRLTFVVRCFWCSLLLVRCLLCVVTWFLVVVAYCSLCVVCCFLLLVVRRSSSVVVCCLVFGV